MMPPLSLMSLFEVAGFIKFSAISLTVGLF